ncbi:DUF3168 domain-containing protein [Rhizobium paknamense]|uniref:DUF3168 domain-containing protein n=1 Tax=Rhizobium paknamense TaxID=1206817 RepID=A0ABU0IAL9_9HYPH|nr:DUF3168 domain-containing protein [Rhizobium paknamense]MDQ0454284.1 hypothetical protein [Rhizobium paknamense]
MSSAVNDLLVALVARLEGDGDLTALIGAGGICDRRLARGREPYVMIGQVEADDLSTDDESLLECRLVLTAWSAVGRQQAEAVAARLRAVIDDADLALQAGRVISLRHRKTVSRREEKTALFRVDVTFRAVVEG